MVKLYGKTVWYNCMVKLYGAFVCACAYVRVRACVRACMRACVRVRACAYVRLRATVYMCVHVLVCVCMFLIASQ